jgi:hypothetical protein
MLVIAALEKRTFLAPLEHVRLRCVALLLTLTLQLFGVIVIPFGRVVEAHGIGEKDGVPVAALASRWQKMLRLKLNISQSRKFMKVRRPLW